MEPGVEELAQQLKVLPAHIADFWLILSFDTNKDMSREEGLFVDKIPL